MTSQPASWLRVAPPAILFGLVGFGMDLLAGIPGRAVVSGAVSWVPALTMAGLGAGTGAGLGAQEEGAFLVGVVGAGAGAGIGLALGLVGVDSWVLAISLAIGLTASLVVWARARTGATRT